MRAETLVVLREGGRAFVSQENVFGTSWTVRVAMPGEEKSPRCAHLQGAPFASLMTTAKAYRAYAAGETDKFEYPPARRKTKRAVGSRQRPLGVD